MKKHFSKRRVVLLAILAVALGIGAGAYAYFTASGTGTGTAAVGNATTIALDGTVTGTLYPAGLSEVLPHFPLLLVWDRLSESGSSPDLPLRDPGPAKTGSQR